VDIFLNIIQSLALGVFMFMVGFMFCKYGYDRRWHKEDSEKCNSCENGFNGKNGNGYQPCGCDNIKVSTPPSIDRRDEI